MNDFQTGITVFLVLFCMNLTSCAIDEHSSPADSWQTTVHEDANFSIDHPTNLQVVLTDEDGYKGQNHVRFSAYNFSWQTPKNLSITVEIRDKPNATPEDVVMWSNEYLDEIKENPIRKINSGFEEIYLEKDQLRGQEIYRRRYAYNKSKLMFEEVYVVRENDMVILTLRVDEAYFDSSLETFNRMVQSFSSME